MPICITGMHRSGTSLLGKMLCQCGLFLGRNEDLIPASPDNPDGHWEHRRFVELNDEVLNAWGGGWDCPPPPTALAPGPSGQSARIDVLRAKARKLADEFAGASRGAGRIRGIA